MTPTIGIRVDGGPGIGAGHVMRCLALAQALADAGARPAFVTAAPARLVRRLEDEGFPMTQPGLDQVSAMRALGPDAVVLDGYGFTTETQERFRAIAPVLVVDDGARVPRYAADIILDQNAGAEDRPYPTDAGTVQLLGARYVLIRRQLLEARRRPRVPAAGPARVLVSLGGTGDGPAERVLAALRRARQPVEIELADGSGEIAELMAWAEVAVAAAGTTAWELAFMGLPSLLLVLAENQHVVARGMIEAGAAVIGEVERAGEQLNRLLEDGSALGRMAAAGRALVDGRGAERVASALLERLATPVPSMP